MSDFVMPSLGADMEAGTLVEQTITPGEAFRRGDVIGAVETQKGVIEVEVFEDGILDRWLVGIGTEVPVGTPLAVIRQLGGEEPDQPPIPPEIPPEPEQPSAPPPPEIPATPEPTPGPAPPETVPPPPETFPPPPEFATPPTRGYTRPRVTPAARRLAARRGVDLGSAALPKDRIVRIEDIESIAATQATTDKIATSPELNMRDAIAAAMSRSKQEIPHYYLSHQTDLTAAQDHLAARNADRAPNERLLLGALYARAIALALKKFPEFNGHYGAEGFAPVDAIHLGIAVHIRAGGLVAPALFDAATREVTDLMDGLRDLVARVRAGRFRARELSDATITLTSLGDRGVDQVVGVIYPPQVAIVGIGTPRVIPAVVDNTVMPRLTAALTLAADHRVSDGHRGALFLRSIDAHLQEPDSL